MVVKESIVQSAVLNYHSEPLLLLRDVSVVSNPTIRLYLGAVRLRHYALYPLVYYIGML